MKPTIDKVKTYFFSSFATSALTAIMYCICSLFAFDITVAYFSSTSLLPYIAKYLLIITIIWIFSILLFIPKNKLSITTPPHSLASRILSVATAVSFILYIALRLLISSNGFMTPTTTFFICNGIALISAAFYLLNVRITLIKSSIRAVLLFPTILWATISMTEAYSNQRVAMNSPIKIMLMLSMMSIMFFALYETRYLVGRPFPRAYAISVLSGICLSGAFSISFIVMLVTDTYLIPEFMPTAIVTLTFTIYQICRAIDFLRHQAVAITPSGDTN